MLPGIIADVGKLDGLGLVWDLAWVVKSWLPARLLSGQISDTGGFGNGLVDDLDGDDTVRQGISGVVLVPPVGC